MQLKKKVNTTKTGEGGGKRDDRESWRAKKSLYDIEEYSGGGWSSADYRRVCKSVFSLSSKPTSGKIRVFYLEQSNERDKTTLTLSKATSV